MSDDHDALAREQEREAADLQDRSDDLGEQIEDAKEELEGLGSSATIPTPDPQIEGVENRPGAGHEGPSQPAGS